MYGKFIVDGLGDFSIDTKSKLFSQNIEVSTISQFVKTAENMVAKVISVDVSEIKKHNQAVGLSKIISILNPSAGIKKNHFFEIQNITNKKKKDEKIVGEKDST